jgi:hypothetical protein
MLLSHVNCELYYTHIRQTTCNVYTVPNFIEIRFVVSEIKHANGQKLPLYHAFILHISCKELTGSKNTNVNCTLFNKIHINLTKCAFN